ARRGERGRAPPPLRARCSEVPAPAGGRLAEGARGRGRGAPSCPRRAARRPGALGRGARGLGAPCHAAASATPLASASRRTPRTGTGAHGRGERRAGISRGGGDVALGPSGRRGSPSGAGAHRAPSTPDRRTLPDDPPRAGHAVRSAPPSRWARQLPSPSALPGGARRVRALGGGDRRAPLSARRLAIGRGAD